MLGVDVYQAGGQLLQDIDADGFVVGETPGAAASGYGAAEDEPVPFGGKVGIGQNRPDVFIQAKLRFHYATVRVRSHHPGFGLGAENQRKGSEEDGFSSSRLSANNDKALRKPGFQRADQNVV